MKPYSHSAEPGCDQKMVDDLTALLVRVERLESLSLHSHRIHSSVVDVVSHTSRLTLCTLYLDVTQNSSASWAFIGTFSGLMSLTMCMWDGAHLPDDGPTWHLPGLIRLKVMVGIDIMNAAFLPSFLASSSFDNLAQLIYHMETMNSDDGNSVAKFFKTCTKLQSLNTSMWTPQIISSIPSSVTHLSMRISDWTGVLSRIPSSVKKLSLEYLDECDWDELWETLQSVLDDPKTGLQQIQFCGDVSWTWVSPKNHLRSRVAIFMTRLLGVSADLSAKGIDVLDVEGKTLNEYFKIKR
jgi:hypothetical protein